MNLLDHLKQVVVDVRRMDGDGFLLEGIDRVEVVAADTADAVARLMECLIAEYLASSQGARS